MSSSVSAIPVSTSRPPSRQAGSRPASRMSISRGSAGLMSPTTNGRSSTPLISPTEPPSAYTNGTARSLNPKRRSSHEQLSVLAAAIGDGDSYLPLPVDGVLGKSTSSLGASTSIREGVPTMDFRSPSPGLQQTRSRSPTRSISRIPVSSVGHARALAEDGSTLGSSTSGAPLPSPSLGAGSTDPLTPTSLSGDNPLSPSPSSPSFPAFGKTIGRKASGSGNTTKVLAELQAGVSNARNALENTKNQLRTSTRLVAQLTRQNEDLKDGRERMRMENENLNHVVARKERLLQELLERARKAEAEAATYKVQLKNETTTSKKLLKDMETQLNEASTVSQKSHREYIILSESLKGLTGAWKSDMDGVRREMAQREEWHRKEVDEVTMKYKSLVKLIQATKSEKARLDTVKQEAWEVDRDLESLLQPQILQLAKATEHSTADSAEALQIAKGIQDELARIRRLMRIGAGPTPSISGFPADAFQPPTDPASHPK